MMINCLFLHQAEGLGYDPKPKEKKKVGQKNIYIYIKYYIHKDFTQKHSTSLRSELVYFTFKFIPFLLKPLYRRWSIFNSNNKKPETDFGEKKKKKKAITSGRNRFFKMSKNKKDIVLRWTFKKQTNKKKNKCKLKQMRENISVGGNAWLHWNIALCFMEVFRRGSVNKFVESTAIRRLTPGGKKASFYPTQGQ